MKLAFHAVDTSAEADAEVADCGFTGESGKAVGLMTEGEGECLARVSWHDGRQGEDEAVVELRRVELWPGRVTLALRRDGPGVLTRMPYDELELTWDDADERSRDLADVFARLLAADPERLVLHLDD